MQKNRKVRKYVPLGLRVPDQAAVLKQDEKDPLCAICLDHKSEDSGRAWIKTLCGHMFHKDCMRLLRNYVCPICRDEYQEKDLLSV